MKEERKEIVEREEKVKEMLGELGVMRECNENKDYNISRIVELGIEYIEENECGGYIGGIEEYKGIVDFILYLDNI